MLGDLLEDPVAAIDGVHGVIFSNLSQERTPMAPINLDILLSRMFDVVITPRSEPSPEGRSMADPEAPSAEAPSRQSSQLFVRRSTGLVREASALDATIFNAVFSAPVGATLAWGVFFALTAFPGADLVAATLWSFVLNVPILIMMALLASSMPKTGGDYVWVSRILGPPAALVSNFGAAFSAIIGATFWARYFPVFALGPVLVTLGTIFNSHSLVTAGTHIQTRDVADAVVYLAGPEAAFISGAVLLIDGGNAAGLPA